MFDLHGSRPHVPGLAVLIVLLIMTASCSSKGSEDLKTEAPAKKNCPPLARTDAAVTSPQAAVVIDVLANDFDADGDPLVFTAGRSSEGSVAIDDAGTPTDSSDDKLLYTPSATPGETATVRYQIKDPDGATSTAEVAIALTDTGILPVALVDAAGKTSATVEARCAPDDLELATDTTVGGPPTSIEQLADADATSGAKFSAASGFGGKTVSRPSSSATTTTVRTTSTTAVGARPTSPGSTQPPATTTTTRPRTTTTSGPPPPCDVNDPTGKSCRDYAAGQRTTTTTRR